MKQKMKYIYFLLIILSLLLVGCVETPTTQNTIAQTKYVCPNGETVNSASLCPKNEVITKTITKYQCEDGSLVESLSNCPKTKIEQAQDDCPDLKSVKPTLSPTYNAYLAIIYFSYNNSDYNWTGFDQRIVDGWDLKGGYYLYSWYYVCRKGSKEGENINYYYCGDDDLAPAIATLHVTDKSGNVIKNVEKKILIVLDSSENYLKTICK